MSLAKSNEEPTADQAQQSIYEIGAALQKLEACGLLLNERENTAESVEHILLTDTRTCDVCAAPEGAICPVSGKPHRRRLIHVAQGILQCVGRTVGKFHTRQATASQRVAGDVKVRVQRRITQNPQLFLLLFYFSTLDDVDDEVVASKATIEYAKYLLDVLRQIQRYCACDNESSHPASGTEVGAERHERTSDSKYGLLLLKSFYKAWQRYVRRAEPYTASSQADQDSALRELLQGTTEALYSALKEKARVAEHGDDGEYADVQVFVSLLLDRVRRLATPEQMAAVNEEVQRWDQVEALAQQVRTHTTVATRSTSSSPTVDAGGVAHFSSSSTASPQLHLANPPLLLSDLNTSGSDLELPPPSQVRAVVGPALPPNWYVDEAGRSRPPPGDELRQKQERFLRNEFRAKKAYEAALNVQPPAKSDDVKAVEAVAEVLYNAQLDRLRADLNAQPKPVLRHVPKVLHQIERQFILAIPTRLQQRVQQELRDVVDWNMIHGTMANVVSIVRFVMDKIIAYGAPFREETLREKTRAVCTDLESATPDLGTAAVKALRFVLDSIAVLREDVAQFSLMIVSSQLKANAVEYIRGFVKNCLPLPHHWESTKSFLARWSHDDRAREWAANPQEKCLSHMSLTSPTGRAQRLVRGAVLFGLLDLLRSANRSTTNRWDDLPAEAFYFEKPTIFTAANAVQECTLLLLLDGTVSSMLSQKRVPSALVMSTVRQLHSDILDELKKDSKLNDLKLFVTDELCATLRRCLEQTPNVALVGASFTDAELSAVGLTIDKMTNTMNPLYVSFEKKVIQSLASVLMADDAATDSLGLIKNTILVQAQSLRNMLAFNWEVYALFYDQLLSSVS